MESTTSTKSTTGIRSNNKGFRNLIVWQRMQELAILVYKLTKDLPADEKFGLISQMRRAVVSVISNFIEGYLKSSKKEKLLYLERSETSLLELEAQAEVCRALSYFTKEHYVVFDKKRAEVGFLLFRYKSKIF